MLEPRHPPASPLRGWSQGLGTPWAMLRVLCSLHCALLSHTAQLLSSMTTNCYCETAQNEDWVLWIIILVKVPLVAYHLHQSLVSSTHVVA